MRRSFGIGRANPPRRAAREPRVIYAVGRHAQLRYLSAAADYGETRRIFCKGFSSTGVVTSYEDGALARCGVANRVGRAAAEEGRSVYMIASIEIPP